MVKDSAAPKKAASCYALFMKSMRDDQKKNDEKTMGFKEFSAMCSQRWKGLSTKDRKKYDDMAKADKVRYAREMEKYCPADGQKVAKRKIKDPNAPKRPMTAFFLFAGDNRDTVKEENPGMPVTDISRELGRRWAECDKSVYEAKALQDRKRYEKDMAAYNKKGGAKQAKQASSSEGESDSDSDNRINPFQC